MIESGVVVLHQVLDFLYTCASSNNNETFLSKYVYTCDLMYIGDLDDADWTH